MASSAPAPTLATSSLVQLGYDLFQFYVPILGHNLGLSASAIGGVLAALATAVFIVRTFLARLVDRYPGEKLLMAVFATGAVAFALLPLAESGPALAIIAFLFGLGMGIGIPLTVILMYSASAEGRSGQTLGLRLTANNLVRMSGPMVFGAISAVVGVSGVLWILGAVMAAGGVMARWQKPGSSK